MTITYPAGGGLAQRMREFVTLRAAPHLPEAAAGPLGDYLVGLCLARRPPPGRGRGLDWSGIARASGVEPAALAAARSVLRPGLEALRRELRPPPAPDPGAARVRARLAPVEPPAPLTLRWEDPPEFHRALDLHMLRHGDNAHRLRRALAAQGLAVDETTLGAWRRGRKAPGQRRSLAVLAALEARWRLPTGYFRGKLPHAARAAKGAPGARGLPLSRELAWHLPDDFEARPPREQQEILAWARAVVLTGATDYRRYQAAASRRPYALGLRDPGAPRAAPEALAQEVRELLAFKTADLTPIDRRRNGVWGAATARQQEAHLGLMFGALAADPMGPLKGAGAGPDQLCLGLLVLPKVWDWALEWRRARRGFYTRWERNLACQAAALSDPQTGWLTQNPQLGERLAAIPALAAEADVEAARADWAGACATLHGFARLRAKEIARLARVHQDPFETILPVLEADSPVGAYRRIADEVARLAPCPTRHPIAAAEAARAWLMVCLALHLGFRQRNLRELLVRRRGEPPTPERRLAAGRRGELRWNPREGGWEVFAPAEAFKNAGSSFFGGRPFRLLLPDAAGLYDRIEAYLETHRPILLGRAPDPGTVFVKTARSRTACAAYDANSFYQAWRAITLRYGVKNPWTGRGAIEGLLPHGPHKVRDVLATHVLKHTGSYEQASYAIQDTPQTVARHYGRFLPRDKTAIAAQVLNRAWAGDEVDAARR